MLEVFALLIVCWGLALLLPQTAGGCGAIRKRGGASHHQIIFFILILILVCFSGLRTRMNDTSLYILSYQAIDIKTALANFNTGLGANPGFALYRIFLRSLGFDNGSVFLFITSAFVTSSYVLFLRKYSVDFSLSIYIFIAMTGYAFTMAAMKQTIAISIGIWAIDAVLNKKYTRFVFLLLAASTFHPYVLIFFVAPWLIREVWSKPIILLICLTVIAGSMLERISNELVSIGASFGDQYDSSNFTGAGVGIYRLLVYLVIPALSILCRGALRRQHNRELNLIINLSIVSSCFMILASFGGANLLGRMSNYFDVFNCLSLPAILHYGSSQLNHNDRVIKIVAICCYAFFYFTYYAKYSTAWNADYYNHISIFELLNMFFGGK